MFEVYGQDRCSYCKNAVELLQSKNINYQYYTVGDQFTVEQYKELFPGRRTVPGIIERIEDSVTVIGGFDELKFYLAAKESLKDVR